MRIMHELNWLGLNSGFWGFGDAVPPCVAKKATVIDSPVDMMESSVVDPSPRTFKVQLPEASEV